MDIVLANPPSSSVMEFRLLTGAGALWPRLNLHNLATTRLKKDHTVHIVDGVTAKEDI